ncbi:MAG: hypothetical protein L6Q66_01950 [Bacteroidia bacterium]|nr:hypothetical protein [Bacteroidia bacterium]
MIYSFITNKDLDLSIKPYFLEQATVGAPHKIKKAEAAAFTQIKSMLNSKFDLEKLFPSIKEFSADKAYVADEYCSYDDVIYKAKLGSTGVTPGTDTSKWEESDPRDALLIVHAVNITIFYLLESVNKRKIPDDVIEAYNRAINWLEDVKNGVENPDWDLIVTDGMEVRSGSNEKIDHYW